MLLWSAKSQAVFNLPPCLQSRKIVQQSRCFSAPPLRLWYCQPSVVAMAPISACNQSLARSDRLRYAIFRDSGNSSVGREPLSHTSLVLVVSGIKVECTQLELLGCTYDD